VSVVEGGEVVFGSKVFCEEVRAGEGCWEGEGCFVVVGVGGVG
jgi:hypothetical protein